MYYFNLVSKKLDRKQVIEGLAKIRQEWEEAAEGVNLVDMQGSVGLILADVVNVIGLLPDEQVYILGNPQANGHSVN